MEDLKQAAAGLNQKTEALKSGQEPVSGEQGAGTASEPYDQGNSEGGLLPRRTRSLQAK